LLCFLGAKNEVAKKFDSRGRRLVCKTKSKWNQVNARGVNCRNQVRRDDILVV